MFCSDVLYHVSLLGTAVVRLRRGGGRDFLCNKGKGGSWLGPPFLVECTQYNGSESLTSPLIDRQSINL